MSIFMTKPNFIREAAEYEDWTSNERSKKGAELRYFDWLETQRPLTDSECREVAELEQEISELACDV